MKYRHLLTPRATLLAILTAGAALLLSGCATLGPSFEKAGAMLSAVVAPGPASRPTPPGPSAAGVPPGTPQPSGPPPGSPKPFDTVVKGAERIDGLLTLYRRDEKVWFELAPDDFGKPFFLSPKLATGIGEAGLFGGLMDDERVIEFRRIHNQVQMIARNTRFIARDGTPEGRAVAASFSPSLLASTPVASLPHAERGSVLVDANALFVNDMLGIGMQLQRKFRQGYGFDSRNSAITTVRVLPERVALQVLAHFATGTIAPSPSGATAGAKATSVPFTVPDPRSLFVTLHYSIAPLPEQPMHARAADPRLGHFTASQWDFGDDLARTPVRRHVTRWRLEPREPLEPGAAPAGLVEPAQPIVYWLDRTIPLQYRDAISAGILEWNKAFERIGFKNAIQVRVQPDDADFDTLDGGASVRWMTNAAPGFGAIGPTHVDPRSGEILGANIGIESLPSRRLRASRTQILTGDGGALAALMQTGGAPAGEDFDARACRNADHAAEQLGYAVDVLAARGELDPNGPDAQRFVLDYLKDTTMHEVGHTLGLRHNFRASRLYDERQLADPAFTRDHALTGSVMEYAPINLPSPGGERVAPFQTTLGPYDYWAIEYAYRPIDASREKAELERIAARSSEPQLAYGTDEDNFLGIDPDALQFDLGREPLVFARKRLAIAQDLFKRQEARALPTDEDYAVLRRSLNFAINDVTRSAGVLARQIGGIRTLRDYPGSGRDPLQPVPADAQRDALEQLSTSLFAADSFVVSPDLQRRLAPDFQERGDQLQRGGASISTDFSLTQRVLDLQRTLLNHLMSDAVAARILDSQGKTGRGDQAFQLSELYDRLERDIWSELGAGRDIAAPRRELQREHLNRLATALLSPGSASRADIRSLARARARTLLARLEAASRRARPASDTRAHLQDSADTLAQALAARLQRSGV